MNYTHKSLSKSLVPKVVLVDLQGSTGDKTGVYLVVTKKWGFVSGGARTTQNQLIN